MRTQYRIIFYLLSASSLASCSVLKTNTAKTLDVYGAGVIQKPVIVDLDVKPNKVTGCASSTTAQSIDVLKSAAVADALESANGDVLVEPKYHIETSGGRTSVTVTGFRANYKNFRPITEQDLPLLQAAVTQISKIAEPALLQKKKGAGLITIVVILGAIAIERLIAGVSTS